MKRKISSTDGTIMAESRNGTNDTSVNSSPKKSSLYDCDETVELLNIMKQGVSINEVSTESSSPPALEDPLSSSATIANCDENLEKCEDAPDLSTSSANTTSDSSTGRNVKKPLMGRSNELRTESCRTKSGRLSKAVHEAEHKLGDMASLQKQSSSRVCLIYR